MESALDRFREVVGKRQWIGRIAIETPGDVLAKLGSGSEVDHRVVAFKELSGSSVDPDVRIFCQSGGA
jgi:hypothetical protein